MSSIPPVDIYLSRRMPIIFSMISFLFLWFFLDVFFLQRVFTSITLTLTPLLFLAVVLFFVLIPVLIIVRQFTYLLRPPIMLHVDTENITIATGFNYNPAAIPTRFLTSVSTSLAGPTLSNLGPTSWFSLAGLRLNFEHDPSIPVGLATSAGVRYGFYTALISRLYSNMSVKKSVELIQPFIVPPPPQTTATENTASHR